MEKMNPQEAWEYLDKAFEEKDDDSRLYSLMQRIDFIFSQETPALELTEASVQAVLEIVPTLIDKNNKYTYNQMIYDDIRASLLKHGCGNADALLNRATSPTSFCTCIAALAKKVLCNHEISNNPKKNPFPYVGCLYPALFKNRNLFGDNYRYALFSKETLVPFLGKELDLNNIDFDDGTRSILNQAITNNDGEMAQFFYQKGAFLDNALKERYEQLISEIDSPAIESPSLANHTLPLFLDPTLDKIDFKDVTSPAAQSPIIGINITPSDQEIQKMSQETLTAYLPHLAHMAQDKGDLILRRLGFISKENAWMVLNQLRTYQDKTEALYALYRIIPLLFLKRNPPIELSKSTITDLLSIEQELTNTLDTELLTERENTLLTLFLNDLLYLIDVGIKRSTNPADFCDCVTWIVQQVDASNSAEVAQKLNCSVLSLYLAALDNKKRFESITIYQKSVQAMFTAIFNTGANVNAENGSGLNILAVALEKDHLDMAKFFYQHHARLPYIANSAKFTALSDKYRSIESETATICSPEGSDTEPFNGHTITTQTHNLEKAVVLKDPMAFNASPSIQIIPKKIEKFTATADHISPSATIAVSPTYPPTPSMQIPNKPRVDDSTPYSSYPYEDDPFDLEKDAAILDTFDEKKIATAKEKVSIEQVDNTHQDLLLLSVPDTQVSSPNTANINSLMSNLQLEASQLSNPSSTISTGKTVYIPSNSSTTTPDIQTLVCKNSYLSTKFLVAGAGAVSVVYLLKMWNSYNKKNVAKKTDGHDNTTIANNDKSAPCQEGQVQHS